MVGMMCVCVCSIVCVCMCTYYIVYIGWHSFCLFFGVLSIVLLMCVCVCLFICDMVAMAKIYAEPKNGLCVSLFRLSIQCRFHISLYIQSVCYGTHTHTCLHLHSLSQQRKRSDTRVSVTKYIHKQWNEERNFFFAPICQKEWKREHYTKIRLFECKVFLLLYIFISLICCPLLHIQI